MQVVEEATTPRGRKAVAEKEGDLDTAEEPAKVESQTAGEKLLGSGLLEPRKTAKAALLSAFLLGGGAGKEGAGSLS